MTVALLAIRAALWCFFIIPICARLAFVHGDLAAAILAAVILGTLANLATATPNDSS